MRTYKKIVIGMIVMSVLSGCAIGPDYKRPEVKIPAKFKQAPKGWKVAHPSDNFNRGQWWKVFNDPDLNNLENKVDISNQNVATAAAQYEQARALVDEAQASFFPTLTGTASATRAKQASAGVSSATAATTSASLGSSKSGVSTTHSLLLNASWEPDIWGTVRRTVEASKAGAQSSEALLASARLSAQASLAQYYFELRGLDKNQQLLDNNVQNDKHILQLVKNQYASGTAARSDVLSGQSQFESAKSLAINNGVNRAIYEHAIAVLIGEPAPVFSIKPKVVKAQVPHIPVTVPSELLERRPDIASSERLMAQANAQIGVAIGAFFPSLTLAGSMSFQHSGLENWISYPLMNWAVGPQIAETILDGGLRSAQVAAARANYKATVATYRETVLAAFQNVEDNLSSLKILQDQQAVADQAAVDAREALKLTVNQYKSGTVSYNSVLTAQVAANNAEITAANVKYQRMTYAVGLISALGGGWNAQLSPC